MTRLVLQLQLLLARIGVLPALAAALFGLAALIHYVAVPELQRQTDMNQRKLNDAQAEHAQLDRGQPVATRYGEFRTRLTNVDDRGDLLKRLFQVAANSGLTLTQGDYRLVPDTEGDFQQWQLSLPIRGSYPQIRAFIDAALQALPSATLDEISLRRDSVRVPTVEAQLRLTLYLKDAD